MVVTERISSLKVIVGILVGVIFSAMISVMFISGSVNLQQFYDVGNVYDVSSIEYEKEGKNWCYNFSTKRIEIDAAKGSHVFLINSSQKEWKYLFLELKGLRTPVEAQAAFFDSSSKFIYNLHCDLQEGRNVLPLQEGAIAGFALTVKGPSSFYISRMQFREQPQIFEWRSALAVFGIVFVCWLPLMFALFLFQRGGRRNFPNRGGWLESLQEAYRCLLCNAHEVFGMFSSQKAFVIRRALFFISLLLVYLMFVMGWRWQILAQRRLVFLLGMCLLLIAFVSWEQKMRAVNWKNPLMSAWLVMWVLCIISEFVVGKTIQHVGIFMLGCMGPLYLSWGSMKYPDRFLKDFLVALRWSYWVSCVFCFLFRPATEGVRFMGIYQNPNSFAGFLVTVNIAFLIWLDENLNRVNLKFGALCKNVLALASICGFLLLTESITSVVVYAAQWMVFIWKQFPNEKTQNYQRNLRVFAVTFFVAIAVTWIPGKICLDYVPRLLDTTISFEGDVYITQRNPLSLISNAAQEPDTGVAKRILEKVRTGDWDSLFSSRTDVWESYLRQMNLFGHSGYLESLNGKRAHAHNALLQMMSYYGVFVAVPYLVLLYYSVKYGILAIFNGGRSGVSLFFLMAAVNYIIQGLVEDMATPFFYISWLTFFIALGGLANQPEIRSIRR